MKKTIFFLLLFFYAFLWITLFLLAIFYNNHTLLITFLDNKTAFPFFHVLQGANIRALIDTFPIMLTPILIALLLAHIKQKWVRRVLVGITAAITAIVFAIDIILIVYKIITKLDFDFRLFWYNSSVIATTIWRVAPLATWALAEAFFFLIVFWYAFLSVLSQAPRPKKNSVALLTILILSFIIQGVTFHTQREAFTHFLYSIVRYKRSIGTYYERKYNEHIQKLLQQNNIFGENKIPKPLGENIFIVQLESVSSLVVNEKITPNLTASAKEGILFPNFYSNSVQTIRAEESILCGLPPTMHVQLMRKLALENIARLPCLPKLLQELGYQTLLFDDFYGGFEETDTFLKTIGFQEMHGYDIMQKNDPKTSWGYREDEFFQRVLEYLAQHPSDKPRFVYITVSATNHAPFDIDEKTFSARLPYPKGDTIEQKAANATFVQDAYLADFLKEFGKEYAEQSSLFILSDTSWPVPIHGNIYNLVGAYEENFLIPMVFMPAKSIQETFATDKIVQERFEQIDILPTILHLINGKAPSEFLGQSLVSVLRKDSTSEPASWKLSLQPYDGGYISLVRFPDKYLFNLTENTVTRYKLDSDPQERAPLGTEKPDAFLPLIENYFLKNTNVSTNATSTSSDSKDEVSKSISESIPQ
ncbi:MAG: hypothetical protein A3B74_03220 [Candidatus Kerfeldbacteria bacterium RIFCSPHIGHO2_02_FULL_42_14]|uniref:Sulfatase N-terminal domain-containing protein n=1 Tax=Candidatus Kerfeldbacteria bacterium RIFCSPHIGHO2_02_FULL_42_14 TaxID=1798540 RepID=A0A1G2APE0_9BACT|nr:MAG: hypothetical protein A3B74_03220 [Candidatus Kerfeldbacteria bacterium RIFCSPHIGHO2_02_FULL_42_14]OGY80919.1 MAG: hypothetical protein A3E60_03135 [Candidatus Kerfeldbacteria bacterium RIFCSPHIGHO2_12_FULL_42_13]OGY84152.1 MAG: hypothetical protein A3I91_01535 [Candidatus Kerfeldbacteria bacterium RIFCSPLOWO2_02_FULL_42_19]OGY87282.1 MAG: hypothetical protein A3G01_03005 [Candidatus Kerfeldbacteria bacterium RIFCSPLOWO2_12_FULL_43_9]